MTRKFVKQYSDPKGSFLETPGVGVNFAAGTTVPADATAGFAPGCIFQDTDAAAGSQLFVNQGTILSASFKAIVPIGVAGVAAGYKVARGATALDGTNPTPVATGLTTVVAFTAILQGTAAPGVGTSILTADISGATVNVYAWKVTGTGDATLIASTGTETFYWIAVGT